MRPSLCLENRELGSVLSLVVLLSGIVPFQVVFHHLGNGTKWVKGVQQNSEQFPSQT